jgi:hypothetical protein
MTLPKAYDPEFGYMFQILTRNKYNKGEWEHCDYAKNKQELCHLLENYRLSYCNAEPSTEFKTIRLPEKYWKK